MLYSALLFPPDFKRLLIQTDKLHHASASRLPNRLPQSPRRMYDVLAFCSIEVLDNSYA